MGGGRGMEGGGTQNILQAKKYGGRGGNGGRGHTKHLTSKEVWKYSLQIVQTSQLRDTLMSLNIGILKNTFFLYIWDKWEKILSVQMLKLLKVFF